MSQREGSGTGSRGKTGSEGRKEWIVEEKSKKKKKLAGEKNVALSIDKLKVHETGLTNTDSSVRPSVGAGGTRTSWFVRVTCLG